jgi:hypothetical protein
MEKTLPGHHRIRPSPSLAGRSSAGPTLLAGRPLSRLYVQVANGRVPRAVAARREGLPLGCLGV